MLKKTIAIMSVVGIFTISGLAYADHNHHRHGRGFGYAAGGVVAGSLLTAAIIESSRPQTVYVQQVPQPVVVQQPIVVQQPVQTVVVAPTEQTVKCPICGDPYKVYSNQVGDTSACPQCIAKAIAKQKK